MTTTITKESLAARIAELESGPRSLKEDYTLAAYKMLLATMEAEPVYQVQIYGQWADTDKGDFYCTREDERRLLYRHVQQPVVSADLLHTAASAIEDLLTTKDRTGAGVWFDLPFRLRSAANAQPAPAVLKDHQIRELVNQLRDIAIEYHGTQQLRERIARVLRAAMLNQK